MFERYAASTHAHCAQLEASNIQNVEGDDVAFADFAQQIFRGHLAVVQNDGASRGAANAQLARLATDGEARKISFHQERSELFSVDLGKDREQVGEAGVGNPHLFAVENVVLAVG